LIFHDVITCIRQEVEALKADGVEIIIALGHAGIDVDIDIAKKVDDVDIVIGGHTNTFLYNGAYI
jgi:5'-nucleotidase